MGSLRAVYASDAELESPSSEESPDDAAALLSLNCGVIVNLVDDAKNLVNVVVTKLVRDRTH